MIIFAEHVRSKSDRASFINPLTAGVHDKQTDGQTYRHNKGALDLLVLNTLKLRSSGYVSLCVCLFVCVYICVCVCVHMICVCTFDCIYLFVYMYVCMFVGMFLHVYKYIISTCVFVYVCLHVSV